MDNINKINETGGAGDWGTDKARERLQKDTPGQDINKGKKMKTFKEMLSTIEEAMSDADKKKRLALIKRAVEKFRKQELQKAKKAAMADMKAAGMFDEEVELQEATASVNKSLEDLVQIGGYDKKDFQKALDLYKAGNLNGLRKHIYGLDTDPSETIAAIIATGDDASFMKMYPNAKGGEYLRSIIISHGGK